MSQKNELNPGTDEEEIDLRLHIFYSILDAATPEGPGSAFDLKEIRKVNRAVDIVTDALLRRKRTPKEELEGAVAVES